MDQGFRMLAPDEIVQANDEYHDFLTLEWHKVPASMIGEPAGRNVRRITNLKAFAEYRAMYGGDFI